MSAGAAAGGTKGALRLLDVLLAAYFVAAFLLTYTQADRALFFLGLLPLKPTLLFALLLGPLVLLALFRRPLPSGWSLGEALGANAGLVVPFAALAAVTLLSAAVLPETNWAEGGIYVFWVPAAFGMFLAAFLAGLLPPVARSLRLAAGLAIALLAATIAWDTVEPTFSRIPSRAAGVAREPNTAAFLLALSLCLALSFRRVERRDLVLIGLAVTAWVGTASRTGALMLALVLATYAGATLWGGSLARLRLRALAPIAVAALLALGGLATARWLAGRDTGMFALDAAQGRLTMLTGEQSVLTGNSERRELVALYWGKILEAPILGHGAGYSYSLPQGPHVRYLQEWANVGLPGLLSYLALLVFGFFTFRRRGDLAGQLMMVLIALWSCFSHGTLEQRAIPLALGLVAAASLPARSPAPSAGEAG